MTEKRSEYIDKAKENLDLINAKIVELEAKANEKGGDIKREMTSKLEDIRKYKQQADRRLDELRVASKPAWEDVKQGAEQAWNSLSDAVERAGKRFQ